MTAFKVLSIDDDPIVHKCVERAVGSHYTLLAAKTAEDGVRQAQTAAPDMILLDIEMPGSNGYEICKKLQQDPQTGDIPIMFLSSRSDLQSRLSGYETGATDFLVKPFQAQELNAKLNALSKYRVLQTQAKTASKTAFAAMRNSSLFGQSVAFIEQSIKTNNFEELSSNLLATLADMGLSASVMINTPTSQEFFSSDRHIITPLEKELIRKIFAQRQRFTDFGGRTQINFSNIALLIKNMPVDDKEGYGLIKDLLPSMLAVTNEKIANLNGEMAVAHQTKNLNDAFDAVHATLHQLSTSLEENHDHVAIIYDNLVEQVEQRLPKMGLDEDQEKYLMKTFDDALIASQLLIDNNKETRAAFETVSRLLHHLGEKQKKILQYFEG